MKWVRGTKNGRYASDSEKPVSNVFGCSNWKKNKKNSVFQNTRLKTENSALYECIIRNTAVSISKTFVETYLTKQSLSVIRYARWKENRQNTKNTRLSWCSARAKYFWKIYLVFCNTFCASGNSSVRPVINSSYITAVITV